MKVDEEPIFTFELVITYNPTFALVLPSKRKLLIEPVLTYKTLFTLAIDSHSNLCSHSNLLHPVVRCAYFNNALCKTVVEQTQ